MSAVDTLAELLAPHVEAELRLITSAPVATIAPSPTNPRKNFDAAGMAELTDSVRRHGVMQPILIRPWPVAYPCEGTRPLYEIVAGERRWRAACAAGLQDIDVKVRDLTDKEVLELQIVENLQRRDLHPLEEADGYERMMRHYGYTADDLAAKIGKSRGYIYGRLKLVSLCDVGRRRFFAGDLNPSVALLVARIPTSKLQEQALREILYDADQDDNLEDETMTVREARDHLQRRYMLDLAKAPWRMDDAALLPKAGSCRDCVKRTGCQPEIFDDVSSADVCTDIECYADKKTAVLKREVAEAKSNGAKVIEGAAGQEMVDRKLMNYPHDEYIKEGAVLNLAAICWNDPDRRSYGQILGDQVPHTLVEDQARNKLVAVVDVATAREKLAELGLLDTRGETSEELTARRSATAKRVEAENTFRQRLWNRLRETLTVRHQADSVFSCATTTGLTRLLATRAFLLMGTEHQYALSLRWQEPGKTKTARVDNLLAHIKVMDLADLALLLLDITLVGGATTNEYVIDSSQPLVLLEAASLLGVDAEAIRRTLDAPTHVARLIEKSAKAAQANRPVAFRCPDFGHTWSGRGQQPAWVKGWLARGKTLDELRVPTQDSADAENTQTKTEDE